MPNNYDYTAKDRAKKRRDRIKELGLKEARVLCHQDDREAIKKYAKELLEKRDIDLTP